MSNFVFLCVCVCVCAGWGGGGVIYWHILFFQISVSTLTFPSGVVGWCEGVVYLALSGRPTDIGLQLGKACYPCSR